MTLGYDKPLYLLAFDHRGSFEQDLFGAKEPVPDDVRDGIIAVKEIIYDAHAAAVAAGAPPIASGILVDEEFGSDVARRAKSDEVPLAMPVEKSGQEEFEFQYGDHFGAHIEAFDPTFAKVLVRYNPDGDQELNRRQTHRLAQLSHWLRDHDRKFLFELLVPATESQLERFGADQREYDRQLRPDLVVATIAALQAGGVEPHIWKIEGLDSTAACEEVVAQARTEGRGGVKCIVLGRGADESQVIEWVRIGAAVDGFDGFAVGRTLWEEALKDYLAKEITRDQAIARISGRYRDVIDAYHDADPAAPGAVPASGSGA